MSKTNRSKEILLFRPNGYRVEPMLVENEGAFEVVSKSDENNPPYRVFKHGPAWTSDRKTYFLAMEGDPITVYVNEHDEIKYVPFREFLESFWGKEAVDRMSKTPQLQSIFNSKWAAQVTVVASDIEKIAQPALNRIKADLILWESNINQLSEAGRATDEPTRMELLIDWATKLILGAGIMYFLIKQGVI